MENFVWPSMKNRMVSAETQSKCGLSEYELTQTADACETRGRLAGPACRWLTEF